MAVFAVVCSYLLRFDFALAPVERKSTWVWMALLAIAHPGFAELVRCYQSTWRFFGLRDFLRLALSSVLVSIAVTVARDAGLSLSMLAA